MKTNVYLLGVLLLILIFGCSKDIDTEYGAFSVNITNKGTSDISDIELLMVGADEVITIKKLTVGQSSGHNVFVLPKFEGDRPESWGDYSGIYSQRDTQKDISVLNYEHDFKKEMTIEIRDQSYVTIFPKEI